MRLQNLIDEAKKLLDIEEDTVLATRLGCSKQEIYQAKKNSKCPDHILEKLADISGIPFKVFWLTRAVDRAKNERIRREVLEITLGDKTAIL